MEKITVTELRNKIYQVMDQIIKTGIPQTVERHGHVLKIALEAPKKSKLDNLKPHHGIIALSKDLENYSVWEDKLEKAWEKKWDKRLKELEEK